MPPDAQSKIPDYLKPLAKHLVTEKTATNIQLPHIQALLQARSTQQQQSSTSAGSLATQQQPSTSSTDLLNNRELEKYRQLYISQLQSMIDHLQEPQSNVSAKPSSVESKQSPNPVNVTSDSEQPASATPSNQPVNPAQQQSSALTPTSTGSLDLDMDSLPSVYCPFFANFAPSNCNPLDFISSQSAQFLPQIDCVYCEGQHP